MTIAYRFDRESLLNVPARNVPVRYLTTQKEQIMSAIEIGAIVYIVLAALLIIFNYQAHKGDRE